MISWDALGLLCALFSKRVLSRRLFDIHFKERLSPVLTEGSKPSDFLRDVVYIWRSRRKRLQGAAYSITHTGSGMAESKSTLLHNMLVHHLRACSKPCDRVYALLGISADAAQLGIIPDYTVPESLLFQHVSVQILSKESDLLSLIYLCGFWDNLSWPELPSWAISHRTRNPAAEFRMAPDNVAVHPQQRYQVNFTADGGFMLLRGRRIDSIKFASSVSDRSHGLTDPSFVLALLATWSKILLGVSSSILPEVIVGLCRCMKCSPSWKPEGSGDDSSSVAEGSAYLLLPSYIIWAQLVHPPLELMSVDKIKRAMERLTNSCKEMKDVGKDLTLTLFESFMRTAQLRRSFGNTAKGRVFSAMNEPHEGDAIFALAGSPQYLWTLRPAADNTYKLVGEIYVDGYMQGELYDGVNPDDVDDEVRIS